jgi:hypothetical protein
MAAAPTGAFAGRNRRSTWGVALAVSAIVFGVAGYRAIQPQPNTVALQRGFFGILRILEGGRALGDPWTLLRNGTTRHGMQFRRKQRRSMPTTYYARATGVGHAIGALQADRKSLDIGVVGLGVGTIAAYGRDGDRIIFYEIDPEVVRIAENSRYFTYLDESAAAIEVVLGDARLSLESELRAGHGRDFDLLVLDAFSSDAVPTHLLTREAFALYTQHLSDDGLLAFHVSNRHVDLAPLLYRLGLELGMTVARIQDRPLDGGVIGGADWILIARNAAIVERAEKRANEMGADSKNGVRIVVGRPNPALISGFPVWTDDYSDIFSVLRRTPKKSSGN